MKLRFRPLVLLVLALCAAVPSAMAQIISNGSFESPATTTFITIPAGSNTLTSWTIGLTGIDLSNAAGNGFVSGPAFSGAQYIDLDGTPGPGSLTQAFATTPGLLYAVTFAYANNYVNAPSPSATVRVFDGAGNRLNQTISHNTSVAGNLNWTVFSGQFTAVQSTTSLEISSLSSNGSQGGILLDAVAVQVVPEPASASFFILGAACCLLRRQRRSGGFPAAAST